MHHNNPDCDNRHHDLPDCDHHKHLCEHIIRFIGNTDNVLDKDLKMFQSEINRWLKQKYESLEELIKGIESGNVSEELLKQLIEEVLKDYKFSETNIDINIIKKVVNQYFEEHPSTGEGGKLDKDALVKIIEEYLKEHPVEGGTVDRETIKEVVEEVIKEIDFSKDIDKAVKDWASKNTTYFEEIIKPIVDDAVDKAKQEILQEVEEYLTKNERVIANALSRHEQAITELQAK